LNFEPATFNLPRAYVASVGTHFANKNFIYRGIFDRKKTGRFNGSRGFSGLHRDYSSTVVETLAPPTVQSNFAAFGLQKINGD
jgi:hypothetical protein